MVNMNKSSSFSNGRPCQQSFMAVFHPIILLGAIGSEDIVLKYQTSLPEQFILVFWHSIDRTVNQKSKEKQLR